MPRGSAWSTSSYSPVGAIRSLTRVPACSPAAGAAARVDTVCSAGATVVLSTGRELASTVSARVSVLEENGVPPPPVMAVVSVG